MYIYDIGYEGYKGSEHLQFFFDKKLTKKELTDYVHQATKNALEHAVSDEDKFFWEGDTSGISFSELYKGVVGELKEFGFKPLEFESKWDCIGDDSVCRSHEDYEDTNKALVEFLPKELKEKALKISREKTIEQVGEEMTKEIYGEVESD